MKTLLAVILLGLAVAGTGYCQNVNWRAIRGDQRNIMQLNFGYDFGVTSQLSYGRSITLIKPAVVELDYSFPMGDHLTD